MPRMKEEPTTAAVHRCLDVLQGDLGRLLDQQPRRGLAEQSADRPSNRGDRVDAAAGLDPPT